MEERQDQVRAPTVEAVGAEFKAYSGVEFLDMTFKKRDWLIEHILRERDTMMFVGDEKAGKSLFIQQMICSLTTCHPFLDKYSVKREANVSYLQLEGELEDTQDRIIRMTRSVDFNPERFQILYYPTINLEERQMANELASAVLAQHQPDVLVIDPLYCACSGSLSDDASVRAFLSNIRWLKNHLKCAVILIHHTHKQRFDAKGHALAEGDEAAFGSKFLKAYPDNIFMLTINKRTGVRVMQCHTQRSGDIERNVQISLVQPDPLYFEEVNENSDIKQAIDMNIIKALQASPNGFTAAELADRLSASTMTIFRALKRISALVEKHKEGRNTYYLIKKED